MWCEQRIGAGFGAHADGTGASCASLSCADVGHAFEKLINGRCRRATFFRSGLFADPAWDILLVLALAEARHQRLSVSRLCDRLDVPATTALRWINTLTEEGLLIRRDDVNDKRRKYIELSRHAYAAMSAYCSTADAELSFTA